MVNAERIGTEHRGRRSSKRRAQDAKIISKLERALDQSGVRPIHKIEERSESDVRAFEQLNSVVSLLEESLPSTLSFSVGWQREKLMSDLERSLRAFRCFLHSLPAPTPLSPLELQAREAWQSDTTKVIPSL